ncbi:cytochrome c5 family protein [Pigmentiphaga aceris]|uniref:Cytochrome c5 family protein n=1 Tax=Pigmentiphaga aceris TaxID=1940612 RepID=A0A5C0B7F4_9BURK|nr:cytochrome c5 family protein [Pigmentiphaga aceris]
MSNVQQTHSEDHESPIRTPKQLAVVVLLSFVVPIVVIILLVKFVTAGNSVGAGSDSLTEESVANRLRPVAGFELRDANAPRVFQSGEAVYKAVCATCHAAGVAGAPKLGDAGVWAPRIAEGFDTMVSIAIKGKGAMPPKGGNPDLDDIEIARAVAYMANGSGGKFEEPAAPAPAAAPAAEGAAPAAAK